MSAEKLTSSNSLEGLTVGISVSDSADLRRLGLSAKHANLAVSEITRAVLLGGGRLVYGGRVKPEGFTDYVIHELSRYGFRDCLTLCLAAPEHRNLSEAEFDRVNSALGVNGRIVLFDELGAEVAFGQTSSSDANASTEAEQLASMRSFTANMCDARVLVGGQLSGFHGRFPGVLEEAALGIERNTPLYIAGGFGGASALLARVVGIDEFDWLPEDMPSVSEAFRNELNAYIQSVRNASAWTPELAKLDNDEQKKLAASHRPGEIASLVSRGLARLGRRA